MFRRQDGDGVSDGADVAVHVSQSPRRHSIRGCARAAERRVSGKAGEECWTRLCFDWFSDGLLEPSTVGEKVVPLARHCSTVNSRMSVRNSFSTIAIIVHGITCWYISACMCYIILELFVVQQQLVG